MGLTTTSIRSDHALPIYVPMACIKSVVIALFTNRRNRRMIFAISAICQDQDYETHGG